MSQSFRTCAACGKFKQSPGVPCRHCGATGESLLVLPDGQEISAMAGSLGLVAQHGAPDADEYRLQVQAPTGTRSDAKISGESVSATVEKASGIGRPAEPAALDTLIDVLRQAGNDPSRSTADDARGEDAVVEVDQQSYTVQFVTVPAATRFWRDAARDSASTNVDVRAAADWLRTAIVAKRDNTSEAERPRTILGLDARCVGVVSHQRVVCAYLAAYPAPRADTGFAATYILGPTASTSTLIGTTAWSK